MATELDTALEQLGLSLAVRPEAFEAVRNAAETHENVLMGRGVALRLIAIMDAAKAATKAFTATPGPASSVLVGEGAENPVRVVLEVLNDWLEENEATDFDENDVAHLFGMLGTAGYSIVPNAALSASASTGVGARQEGKAPLAHREAARDLCYSLRDLGLPTTGAIDHEARTLILAAFAKIVAAPQHLVVGGAAATFPHLVPITSFSQVQNGDSLLIVGNIDGVQQHLFHKVTTKESASDGQEIILKKKGNMFFNFGMYLDKQSWVKQCYKLQAAPADEARA